MKLPRRHFLHLAAGAAALPALSRNARAQAYPTRPVRIIAGFPPRLPLPTYHRAADVIGSIAVGTSRPRQFIVDNRPGPAAGNVATEAVVRVTPSDSYHA